MINIIDGLTFDDLLLIPKYSEIKSRADVDLTVALPKGFWVSVPVIPANMKTICEDAMAEALYQAGGLAIIHRFMPLSEQVYIAKKMQKKYINPNPMNYIGFSIGVKDKDYDNVHELIDAGIKIICIDVAHGDSKLCVDMCKYVSKKFPNILLIAGNVATGEGAKRLWLAGADLVKVGVGSSGICSTRLETGNGSPQMTAIADAYQAKLDLSQKIKRHIGIISDGGCNKAADVCKSLCFADLTMIGGLVAGAEECPSEKFEEGGKIFKRYDGSSTYKGSRVEGVKAVVAYKGPVSEVLGKLCDGIQSCCSYQGVNNLVDLKKNPQFIRMTGAGREESAIHNIVRVAE